VKPVTSIAVNDEAHWHELRRRHVGGSEVAALFGEHAQLTAWELWQIKAGKLPEHDLSDNERVLWGSLIEPAVAQGVSRLMGWQLRKVRRYLVHPTVPGFGGTPDYEIINHERGPGILEIKTVDRMIFRDWGDEPPLGYLLQLQSYLELRGCAWGAIAVLVGGNELQQPYIYERRPKTGAMIRDAVAGFWQSQQDGLAPPMDFDRDGAALSRLYVDSDGGSHDLTGNNRLPELFHAYKGAAAQEKEAGAAKDAAKAEIMSIIETREIVTCAGWKLTARTVPESPISYVRKPYRTFSLTPPKEKKNVEPDARQNQAA
jgi:predicted phage-related endonuclease